MRETGRANSGLSLAEEGVT
nr:hypothetical protein [Sicyoidochytrium minutum DNA virus]